MTNRVKLVNYLKSEQFKLAKTTSTNENKHFIVIVLISHR